MGCRWGTSRTVGEIHALLYVSPRALNAEDLGEALACSRSNVSMGLKALQSWNLVRLQHWPNNRREYFPAADDVHVQVRMKQKHDLIELMTGWLTDLQKMDSGMLISLMKIGVKVKN